MLRNIRNVIENKRDLRNLVWKFMIYAKDLLRFLIVSLSSLLWKIKAKQPKIIIAGLGRSGTTALYFKIKKLLNKNSVFLFEPKITDLPRDLINSNRGVLIKTLLSLNIKLDYNYFKGFNKKIFIARDPRDIIVSTLLYKGGYHFLWRKTLENITSCLSLIKQKEKDPNSVSTLRLFKYILNYNAPFLFAERVKSLFAAAVDFSKIHKDYFIIKYEDFIYNKLRKLEGYLDISLMNNSNVDNSLKRVKRTKSAGDWRNWFLEEDIAFFKSLVLDYMSAFNYDFEDWKLNKEPIILPKHASEYIKTLMESGKHDNASKGEYFF
jgi:hypothetical protein